MHCHLYIYDSPTRTPLPPKRTLPALLENGAGCLCLECIMPPPRVLYDTVGYCSQIWFT
jgi:hypothetical protein